MTTSEKLIKKTLDNAKQKETIKLLGNKILELGDKINALENENGVLEREVKEWNRKQQEGYCWYTVAPDTLLITNMGEVLGYSNFTYVRPIPKEIHTALYKRFPYYQLDKNGKLDINTIQAKKYKGVI